MYGNLLRKMFGSKQKRVQHFRKLSNMGILWNCCFSSYRRGRRVSQICIIDSCFSLTWNLHIKIWCNSLSVFPRLSFFDVAFVALKIASCSFRRKNNNIRKLILSLGPISDASHCCTDIKCCEVFFLFLICLSKPLTKISYSHFSSNHKQWDSDGVSVCPACWLFLSAKSLSNLDNKIKQGKIYCI